VPILRGFAGWPGMVINYAKQLHELHELHERTTRGNYTNTTRITRIIRMYKKCIQKVFTPKILILRCILYEYYPNYCINIQKTTRLLPEYYAKTHRNYPMGSFFMPALRFLHINLRHPCLNSLADFIWIL
jgi:hypothetical protein